jgi:hypothetical protein
MIERHRAGFVAFLLLLIATGARAQTAEPVLPYLSWSYASSAKPGDKAYAVKITAFDSHVAYIAAGWQGSGLAKIWPAGKYAIPVPVPADLKPNADGVVMLCLMPLGEARFPADQPGTVMIFDEFAAGPAYRYPWLCGPVKVAAAPPPPVSCDVCGPEHYVSPGSPLCADSAGLLVPCGPCPCPAGSEPPPPPPPSSSCGPERYLAPGSSLCVNQIGILVPCGSNPCPAQ